MMRKCLLTLANFLAFFWQLLPNRVRLAFFSGMLILESRHRYSSVGLTRLLLLRDKIDWIINERAMVYGEGEHPKHRLTDYHQFFIDRIKHAESVLDVGCGYGAVSRSIARAHPDSNVVGIDHDTTRLAKARDFENLSNLKFIYGDATREVPAGDWDVVILSNVLEHIDERVIFLKALSLNTRAKRYLIRVPMFERDWQMALRRELGIDFRSDPDHRIEHTTGEFLEEISQSGLDFVEMQTLWGEIWADCRGKEHMT